MSQAKPYTWRFDVTVEMGALSTQEEACDSFKEILNAANETRPISGLEQSSFSYDVPDNCLANFSGYLHVDKRCTLYETTVQAWIVDDRIRGAIKSTDANSMHSSRARAYCSQASHRA
jgi:hypothetical protein